MKQECKDVRELLALDGVEALRRNADAERHVGECDACYRSFEDLAGIEAGLSGLARHDAPDEVVEALLARSELLEPPAAPLPWWRKTAQRLASGGNRLPPLGLGGAVAAMLVVAVGLGLLATGDLRFDGPDREAGLPDSRIVVKKYAPPPDDTEKLASLQYAGAPENARRPGPSSDDTHEVRDKNEAPLATPEPTVEPPPEARPRPRAPGGRVRVTAQRQVIDIDRAEPPTRFSEDSIQDLPVPGRYRRYELDNRNKRIQAQGVEDPDGNDAEAMVEFDPIDPLTDRKMDRISRNSIEEMEVITGGAGVRFGRTAGLFAGGEPYREAAATVDAFLARRSATEGLTFHPRTGYWANTLVPGDPELRLLQAALVGRDRAALQAYSATPLRLHDAARRAARPFDMPEQAAVALQLAADRRGLEGPGRVRLQVGLSTTPSHAGRRPAMNVAVVLDLRTLPEAGDAATMRAFVDALGRLRDVADRFRLIVAGRGGDSTLGPDEFRHGALTLTLDRLLSGEPAAGADSIGLAEALERATAAVSDADDDTAPLGSSAVILVTAQRLGDELPPLLEIARESAVAGVPLSVVSIGKRVGAAEVRSLVLAGQGNRRILERASQAADAADRELSAVSRVVARAVRLNVRLAPGVQLVDVLGSELLDASATEHVRRAERSIDVRVARNLGIEADRGQDDDGIQIVIPNLPAGETHVILFDLLAPGPGPLAEAEVRFKDLVHLRNGSTRAAWSLDATEAPAGPRELNVLRNELAQRMSETLSAASVHLGAGDPARAAGLLRRFGSLLAGLEQAIPGLAGDPDVLADRAMLDEYVRLIDAGSADDRLRIHLYESLRYAARLKILPPPAFP